jgi:hypothetical protein
MTTYVQLVYWNYIYLLGYFDEKRIFLRHQILSADLRTSQKMMFVVL